jgi:hypothetical protein
MGVLMHAIWLSVPGADVSQRLHGMHGASSPAHSAFRFKVTPPSVILAIPHKAANRINEIKRIFFMAIVLRMIQSVTREIHLWLSHES